LQPPCGSDAAAGTLLQVPAVLEETLQDLQVPLQFVAQQTPWLQKVDLHSLPLPQVLPLSFKPQEPLVLHIAGESQSLFVVQADLQALVPQT
jgi:hypothetical protein